jgi:hypothetical protein
VSEALGNLAVVAKCLCAVACKNLAKWHNLSCPSRWL